MTKAVSMRLYYTLLFVILSLFADAQKLQQATDSFCNGFILRGKSVGLSVAVIKDGMVYMHGYGFSDSETRHVPDENTMYEIASISKVFTASMAELMVEQGKLSWNDEVSRFFVKRGKPLKDDHTTLMNLVSHTSGFPGLPEQFFPHMTNQCDPYKDLSFMDLYDYLENDTDKVAPDLKNYQYSNLGFMILAHILELRTGKFLNELLQEMICKPLNMEHTTENIFTGKDIAVPYDREGRRTCYWTMPALQGHGAVRSNVKDMVKFLQANMNGKTPLAKSLQNTHKQITAFPSGGVCYGWHVDTTNLAQVGIKKVIFHNGQTGGFHTYMGFVPGTGAGVIVLANKSEPKVDRLALTLLANAVKIKEK